MFFLLEFNREKGFSLDLAMLNSIQFGGK